MFIDSKWLDTENRINVYDPYDNSLIDTVPDASEEDAIRAVDAAKRGFEVSRKLTAYEKANILYKTAEYIRTHFDDFATTIARESSKTIKEARKETSRCINTMTISAEEAKRINGETIPFDSFPGGEKRVGYYYRFPIGIVLAITPFNDPLNLVAHKLGPAFAAGNSVILKPASMTPLSAIKLGEALLASGLPPQCLQIVTGRGEKIGSILAQHEDIRMLSFTGGLEAGKRLSKIAGLKKIGMELGSNSPVIVWKDADIDYSAKTSVSGAFWAAGQNCIGVQRIYIHKDVYEQFKTKFVEYTKKYKIGNKMLEETDMGPMISEGEAVRVENLVKEAIKQGAVCLCGGKRNGAVFEPTVFEKIPLTAKLHTDEVFGPTVNLYQVSDLDDAIRQANSLPFGLHAAVLTNDINIALKVVYNLECGGVIVNDSTDYRLDSMPFGGIKNSGLGREGIKFALQEMTEPKVVCFSLRNI
jgi:glyceraldehyde-3-phosphate dehydrogenase (NADP+)